MNEHRTESPDTAEDLSHRFAEVAPVITVDPDRVMRSGRRRRAATRMAAGAGAVVAVLALALFVAPELGGSDPASSPPPEPDRSVYIEVLPALVQPGDTVKVVYMATEPNDLIFGFEASLERWDGHEWQRAGVAQLCFEESRCIGSVLRDWPEMVNSIGLSAAPGEPAETLVLSTEGLGEGWYRLVQYSDADGTVAAGGIFEVRGEARTPPPEPARAVSIEVFPEVVRPGDAVTATYVAREPNDMVFGFEIALHRWDGEQWQHHGYARPCYEDAGCIGQVLEDYPEYVLAIGMSVAPGEPGPSGVLGTEELSEGWYRLAQFSRGELAAGIFEVRASASAAPPVPAGGEAWLTVGPAVVPPTGGLAHVTTKVASDAYGSRSQEDMIEVDDALDTTVSVQRWDGERWLDVTSTSVPEREPDAGVEWGVPVVLPALEEGAYRLVRAREGGESVWGNFTVAARAPALP